MQTIVLSQAEVRRLLPMSACIECMATALAALDRGEATNPLRWPMRLEGGNILGMMPGALHDPAALGIKLVTVFPGNHGTELDSHQGVVMLFDPERGVPLAILDGSEVTAIRTAAVSGLATRLLAREDAGDLAILGSGVQARTHLSAMREVRSLRRVRIFSPNTERRRQFAEVESKRFGIEVEAVDSARDAVRDADLICTTSSATEPILFGDWVSAGAHVNAAGACTPKSRELDGALMARAKVFVDSTESAENEAGDLLLARAEGAVGADAICGELGALVRGNAKGRGSPDDVTVFESLGLAVEDLAAALHVLEKARAEGVGTAVDLGGLRDAPLD